MNIKFNIKKAVKTAFLKIILESLIT